ncbi:MAG: LLM class F420-dependent oxidoreductase [Proteobacteria bacterium]|nr:LLM class F420-dependent oxidoreductase [Pseudomonadota bacterium]
MQWGVHLPHLGRNVSREVIMQWAQVLEELGYHSAWVSDHVCWPREIASKYPYTDDGSFAPAPDMGWLDPIGTQLFVAGCTTDLRLGFTVLILPYRQPVVTAKQLATLDVLSGGRLILGCGVGWMREEAEILGMPWDNRGARTDEQLQLFTTLFNEAVPSFDGQYYQLPEVGFEPKPIQKPVPFWIGGSSDAAMRRVARFGHGFHAAFQPLAQVKREFDMACAEAEKLGRNPDELTLSLRTFLDPAGLMEPDKSIAGSATQMCDRIGEMLEIGIDHVLLDPVARGGVAARLEAVQAVTGFEGVGLEDVGL